MPTAIPSGILNLDPSSSLATIRRVPKIGATLPPFWGGELGRHLTQCRLDRGLPPYQVASRSIQPFGHNSYGPKIGGEPYPFGRVSWVPI